MSYECANPDYVGYPGESPEEGGYDPDWEQFVNDAEGEDWFSVIQKDQAFIDQQDAINELEEIGSL